jgi:hypothetical protein
MNIFKISITLLITVIFYNTGWCDKITQETCANLPTHFGPSIVEPWEFYSNPPQCNTHAEELTCYPAMGEMTAPLLGAPPNFFVGIAPIGGSWIYYKTFDKLSVAVSHMRSEEFANKFAQCLKVTPKRK